MGVDNWATTAADNAIQGNVDFREGMAPAKVNDSAREMMAQIARNILDRSGALTSTGSAGVFALATNTGITQLKAGLRFTFKANVASVGGDTLNVDAKGAKKLRVVDDDGERDIAEDEIDAGGFYDVVYDPDGNSSAGAWIVQTADFTAITADIASVQSSLNTHKADTGNPHSVTKAQVGLGNADNTSDADKPISTAQNTAITARLYKASNLSDLPSKATARTNLDVYSKAEVTATFGNYLPLSGGTVTGNLAVDDTLVAQDIYADNGALILNDSEGAYADRNGTNIDHLWHDDGDNAWHLCSDAPYKSVGNAKLYLGELHSSQTVYVGADGGGDSVLQFWDDNSNAWRGLYWDDSTNYFRMENNDGSTGKVWNSANDGAGSGLNADMVDNYHADEIMSIGINQTWQDVTGSRAGDTSYHNTTGRPIMVSIHHCDGFFSVSANNSDWLQIESGVAGVDFPHVSHVIPAGWYYKMQTFSSSERQWLELR